MHSIKMITKPDYVYITFDVFPSKKGASTHINHCLKALQKSFKTGLLICLGNDDTPSFQYDQERNLYVYRWKQKVVNFLERTDKFQSSILKLLKSELCTEVKLIHFRDIWSGLPALTLSKSIKTVFEVNAFSSIELPNRYPNMSQSLINRIKKLEEHCITNATAIITPSVVTKTYILNTFKSKDTLITVIPNGVIIYDIAELLKNSKPSQEYILYFGALQKWQGIKTLFKAFKELEDLSIRLIICSSVPEKRTEIYQELATQIGVNDKIDWFFELDKKALAIKIKNAKFTVAPLASCNRNLIQGCNPLKIIESMGYGTPVVASNIPVVAELIENNVTGFIVPPDRPESFGRKMRELLELPLVLKDVGLKSEKHIEKNYLWEYQEEKMKTLYHSLLEYA